MISEASFIQKKIIILEKPKSVKFIYQFEM